MVTAGTLTIAGQMDTSAVQNGFQRIRSGFRRTERDSKGMNSTLAGIASSAKTLGNSLLAVGAAGATALTGLATQAPQLAPQFAKMRVEMFKMSRTAGQALEPAFSTLANTVLPKIGDFLDKHSGSIRDFANNAAKGADNLIGAVQGDWDSVKSLIPAGGGAAAGFAIGARFGRPFLGAALGAAAGSMLTTDVSQEDKEKYGDFAETKVLANDMPNFWDVMGVTDNDETITESIQESRQAVKLLFNAIVDSMQYVISQGDEKDREQAVVDGRSK